MGAKLFDAFAGAAAQALSGVFCAQLQNEISGLSGRFVFKFLEVRELSSDGSDGNSGA